MVKFCNKCNRAVDDLDKFCRSCGQGTDDSIDYHTYYRFFIKDKNDQQSLLWFMKGAGIALQQEIKEIKEKVDIMHQKLFPPSVDDRVVEEKEEKSVEESIEKKDEPKKDGDIKKEDRPLGKKEEHKEEKPVEHIPEIEVEKKTVENLPDIEVKVEEKEEPEIEKIEKSVEHIPEIEKIEKPVEHIPEIEKIEKSLEHKEDNIINIDNPNLISTATLLENKEKEDWPWPEEGGTGKDISQKQDIPEESNDKLNMLLQEDEGQRQAVQYLIHKYNKNKSRNIGGIANNKKSDDKSSIDNNTDHSITIIPSEDVVKIGRARGKGKEKGEPYKMYEVAIHNFIPDILKSIEGSSDGVIRMRLLDVAKKMGEKFVDKKPVTVYTGLKYTLFDHKIVVEMGSLKEVDPVTKENIKILKMRMKNPDDTLPPSLLERRGETVKEKEDEKYDKM